MTPAWNTVREALRSEGLDLKHGPVPTDGLQLRVNGHLTVGCTELPEHERMCLFWGSVGDHYAASQEAHAWVQSQRDDPQGGLWTKAHQPSSGARIMASSVPSRTMDTVTFRTWLGHYLDWIAAGTD